MSNPVITQQWQADIVAADVLRAQVTFDYIARLMHPDAASRHDRHEAALRDGGPWVAELRKRLSAEAHAGNAELEAWRRRDRAAA